MCTLRTTIPFSIWITNRDTIFNSDRLDEPECTDGMVTEDTNVRESVMVKKKKVCLDMFVPNDNNKTKQEILVIKPIPEVTLLWKPELLVALK